MKKAYEGKDVTVYFDSEVCIHSGHCVKSLPSVFDVKKRPWIEADGAEEEEVMRVIDVNCSPSSRQVK
ncbi:(4Fe-4S)-binding protein [Exiguobacterium sp. H66]|uniref:(4Fe-4S)-binding protein n=1 Tax=Exiguobacterium sp. H66 TaxID=2751208 RepID=UPI001BEC10B8|nr:(4Fe-4S)-binding protein [Exiguobacterium sp. H66]